ncbi:MAG: glycosyltransferase [Candidatus Omnitrophica bacterium]|nr:glycosyltransferase [Candidatus Omnitrophota bacterium]
MWVYRKLLRDFPNLRLIIAPRHIERARRVRNLAGRKAAVNVIDRIGVLNEMYSIADIVFVGGSLIPHGGQNIIEPAVFAKPVLFGPYMFNFKDEAREFLANGAAVMVKDKAQLRNNCKKLLSDAAERVRLGENARTVVLRNQGALEKCLNASREILRYA